MTEPTISMTRDIEDLKQHSQRNADSVTRVLEFVTRVDERVKSLEIMAQARAITEAREDERDKALYRRLDEEKISINSQLDAIKKDVSSIKGLGAKALWVVGGAVLIALAKFILSGGLV